MSSQRSGIDSRSLLGMFETLSILAKFLFINEDKVDLNAEDLKSPCMLEAPGVAGVKKTEEFRKLNIVAV